MAAALDRVGVRAVFAVAWPIMISMLSRSLLVTVDTIFVSHLGTTSVAALGLAVGASWVPIVLGLGVASAVGVLTAQRVGAGRPVDDLLREGLGLALLAGVGLWLLIPLGPVVFPFLGTDAAGTPLAAAFFALRVLGAPLELGQAVLTGWFTGRGDTRTPMVTNLLVNGLNIALDALFVLGLGWGVPGAAVATELSIVVGFVFLARRAGLAPARPSRAFVRQAWSLGAPAGVGDALDVLAFVLFGALLAHLGEAQMAAHVIVVRILSMTYLPANAAAEATSVLVGQALGAGQARRARQALGAGMRLAVGIMLTGGVVFVALPDLFLSPFSPEDEVRAVAGRLLWIAAGFQLFDAMVLVVFGALRGAGDARFVMRAALLPSWLVKLPVGVLAAAGLGWGAAGAWLGLLAEVLVVCLIALQRVRGTAWLRRGARVAAAA